MQRYLSKALLYDQGCFRDVEIKYAIMPRVDLELGRSVGASSRTVLDAEHKRQAIEKVRPESWFYPALVILLTVFAIAPLTYPGFFQSHTGLAAVYNLIDLHAHPASGWAPTFGREFDLFRMDGPLGYSVAELFHVLGLSFLDSVKAVYALAFVLSGVGVFVLSRRILSSNAAGLLSAMLYVYLPYHVALVYVSGAFGEAVAWALFPWALLAILKLRAPGTARFLDYALASLSAALLTLAQPGLAVLFVFFAVVWIALVPGHTATPRAPFAVLGTMLVGLGIGILPMIPAASQNGFAISEVGFTSAFVYPFQFLTASWGTALPKGSYLDPFPFQIGIAALALLLLAVALVARPAEGMEKDQATKRAVFSATLVSAILLLLMTPFAAPLWTLTGIKFLVQYPFQLFAFVGLALSLAVGSIPRSDPRLRQVPMVAALSALPILAVYAYLAPEYLDFAPTRAPLAVLNQNELALLDAKIVRPPGVLRHGATVELELHWQALRQVNHDYTIFVHAADESGRMWGGEDSKPQGGALPTIKWMPGRVISDTHTVQIDLAGPPEGYHLELGLYTAATGERAVTDTGATEIRIEENR